MFSVPLTASLLALSHFSLPPVVFFIILLICVVIATILRGVRNGAQAAPESGGRSESGANAQQRRELCGGKWRQLGQSHYCRTQHLQLYAKKHGYKFHLIFTAALMLPRQRYL